MLDGKTSVGGDKEYAVNFFFVRAVVVMEKLQVVEVHDDGFSTAGRHPVTAFGEIGSGGDEGFCCILYAKMCLFFFDEGKQTFFEFSGKFSRPIGEVGVKVCFGEECCQPLVVFEVDGCLPVFIDFCKMAGDVVIVLSEFVGRKGAMFPVGFLSDEDVVVSTVAVLVGGFPVIHA